MGAAYFYHLTRSTAEETLPLLIERALGQGWRVAIRGTDPAALEALDASLWYGDPTSFLPHGLAGGAHDADQPVLLTTGTELANGAACLMLIDGAATTPEEAAALSRVCVLFDGEDAAAVEGARALWRGLTSGGVPAQYWSQADGPWRKKAESG